MDYKNKRILLSLIGVFFLLTSFFGLKNKVLAYDFTVPDQVISNLGLKTSTSSAYFNNPKGVTVDSVGNIYVADTLNNRIQKYDVGTSQWIIIGNGTSGTDLGYFGKPSEISVGNSGNIYVADTLNNRIQKYDVGTSQWTFYGSYGANSGEFNAPKGVVSDSVGNIYVADYGNNRIQKYDAVAGSWSVLGTGNQGSNTGEFNNPNGIAVDNSGNIYVADSGNNRIQKYDVGAGSWSVLASGEGNGLGQFFYPSGISVGNSGNIYVADMDNNRIQKYDVGTTNWTELGSGEGNDLGQFESPSGVSVDSLGNVYVADTMNNRIKKYEVGTDSWIAYQSYGSMTGEFKNPSGVVNDNLGNIYVADTDNDKIQKYDVGTSSWMDWGNGIGTSLGYFNYPNGIAVDSFGNVYVADTLNNRIQKNDVGTTNWTELGNGQGLGLGQFESPSGVSVDSFGNIYVADSGNNRIQKYNVGTTSWTELDSGEGLGLGQFESPSGVSVDSLGNIYVADSGNNRIQKYDVGTSQWTLKGDGVSGSGLGEFNGPKGVVVDSFGNIYVADTGNNRIQKYNVETDNWMVYRGNGLDGFTSPSGINVDSFGNIYVADAGNNRIQKLTYYKSPSVPWGLGATPGNGKVSLSWTTPLDKGSSDITDYQIEYTVDGIGWTIFNDGVSINTGTTVTDLTNDQSYSFRVSAINSVGVGTTSTVVSATPTAPAPPSEPLNLSATPGNNQVSLIWTTPISQGSSTLTDYQIEYMTTGIGWTIFDDGVSINTGVTIPSLTNDQSYSFRVSAINSIGIGITSTVVSATPTALIVSTVPSAPLNLDTTPGNGKVSLSWTTPLDKGSSDITDYQIEYTVDGIGWTIFNDGVSINTGTTVTDLTNDQSYSFRVSAINSVGVGTTSTVVSETPISLAPTGVGPTITSVTVGATDISSLVDEGAIDVTMVSYLTMLKDTYINIGEGSTLATINLSKDTQITRDDGQPIEFSQFSAESLDKNNVTNLTPGFVPEALIQWGTLGITLDFSKPIGISMYLGDDYNGQTLNVLRSQSVSSGWTSDGLVDSTCVVANGICQFSTNKASYFTVVSYQVVDSGNGTTTTDNGNNDNQSSSNNSSSGSSGGGGVSYTCNDAAPTSNPDLFELKTSKSKTKLFYTPSGGNVTSYAVIYGLKKGDERFGTIVSTVNGNDGIQSTDINLLNPKVTYYFKVAAINGCNISNWSEWVPVKADRTKTVYKYKTIIKNKIQQLINLFK